MNAVPDRFFFLWEKKKIITIIGFAFSPYNSPIHDSICQKQYSQIFCCWVEARQDTNFGDLKSETKYTVPK